MLLCEDSFDETDASVSFYKGKKMPNKLIKNIEKYIANGNHHRTGVP
jgi:hypothetical protein